MNKSAICAQGGSEELIGLGFTLWDADLMTPLSKRLVFLVSGLG